MLKKRILAISIISVLLLCWLATSELPFRNTTKYPLWATLSRENTEKTVDSINKWYQNRKNSKGLYPQGVVFKIIENKIEFTLSRAYNTQQRPFLSYGNLKPCSKKSPCSFCKGIKNKIRIPENQHIVVKSKSSGIPLIIDKENPTGCWFDMDKAAQIKMLEAAQKLARMLKRQNLDVSKAYIESHNGTHGEQTVGHTHLRIEGVPDGWFELLKKKWK